MPWSASQLDSHAPQGAQAAIMMILGAPLNALA